MATTCIVQDGFGYETIVPGMQYDQTETEYCKVGGVASVPEACAGFAIVTNETMSSEIDSTVNHKADRRNLGACNSGISIFSLAIRNLLIVWPPTVPLPFPVNSIALADLPLARGINSSPYNATERRPR
jgi:hypothetical protein